MIQNNEGLATIGVVITAFERLNRTMACVLAVLEAGIPAEHIILVDGGSELTTVAELQHRFPDICLISGLGNLWWAEGMNVGLARALNDGYAFCLILNQDCIIEPETVIALLDAARHYSSSGVFASIVLDRDHPTQVIDGGHHWQAHARLPGVWILDMVCARGSAYRQLPQSPYTIEIFTGRGVLVRRDVFEQVGLFDARHFPQRGGDEDLSLRVHAAGIGILAVTAARTYTGADDCGAEQWPQGFWKHLRWALFNPIGGQGLRVHFWFVVKHCSIFTAAPTYFYRIANLVRMSWRQTILIKKVQG